MWGRQPLWGRAVMTLHSQVVKPRQAKTSLDTVDIRRCGGKRWRGGIKELKEGGRWAVETNRSRERENFKGSG